MPREAKPEMESPYLEVVPNRPAAPARRCSLSRRVDAAWISIDFRRDPAFRPGSARRAFGRSAYRSCSNSGSEGEATGEATGEGESLVRPQTVALPAKITTCLHTKALDRDEYVGGEVIKAR